MYLMQNFLLQIRRQLLKLALFDATALHSFHRAGGRTRTRRTGYAHPRTWNLAGRLVGAASKMIANATLS